MGTTFNGPVKLAGGVTVKRATGSITCDGATSALAGVIPAGAVCLGVNAAVRTAITGATSFQIGDGSDADRWGDAIDIAAGTRTTSADYVAGNPVFSASAVGVTLTATGSDFTAGVVDLEAFYYEVA